MILAELTLAAGKAWRQRGHPGWYAAGEEGPPLLTLFRHQVASHCNACFWGLAQFARFPVQSLGFGSCLGTPLPARHPPSLPPCEAPAR